MTPFRIAACLTAAVGTFTAVAPLVAGSAEPVVLLRSSAAEDATASCRIELLDPDAGVFRVVEEHTTSGPLPVGAADAAAGLAVYDAATGRPIAHSLIAADEARALGEPAATGGGQYVKLDLPRASRLRIERTSTAPASLHRNGINLVLETPIATPRATVVLPPRYEVISCNYPCQLTSEADGRVALGLLRSAPGGVSLRIEAAPLRGSEHRANFGEPAPAGIPVGRETARDDFDFRFRADESRDIAYFLQQPETHSFRLYHDFTEDRAGRDKYVNVVRRGSAASDPAALNLDTGEPLKVETLAGDALRAIDSGSDDPIGSDSQAVVAHFSPLAEGQSIRLRIEETYTDEARYTISEDILIWDRALVRGRNSIILPSGWYPILSAAPATFDQLEDGRGRLDFMNPSADAIQVLILARRRLSPETRTVGGGPLEPDEVASERQREREKNLLGAWRAWMADPRDEQKTVVYARHLAWYGRFQDAIVAYAEGLRDHPESYRLLRHRGHRLITLRRFDEAAADLAKAAPLAEAALAAGEADRADDDTVAQYVWSSWYHLGLAEYYRGNFSGAEAAFRSTLRNSATDDKRNAASYWLCNTLWRMGRGDETAALLEPVREGMEVQDNISYYELLRIFKGLRTVEETIDLNNPQAPRYSTVAYGIANWYWFKGEKEKAKEIFERILSASAWNAFGNLGAEVALKELGGS